MQWFTAFCSRIQQRVLFLPELFLGIVSCFWFISDIPKPEAFDNRGQKIAIFLLYLLCCVLVKLLLYFRVLREKGTGQLSWAYTSFFLAMIELGCFFDLYIVGYSEHRSLPEIIEYVLYWYIPLGFVLAVCGILSLRSKGLRIPFLKHLQMKQQRKKRRAGLHAEEPSPLRLKLMQRLDRLHVLLCRKPVLVLLMIGYLVIGSALFFALRGVSSSDLAALNFRSRLCEGSKLIMFALLYLFAAARASRRADQTGISERAWAVMSFLTCILTAGMYLLAGEFGSAIIIVLFAVLMVIYFFSERWGFVLAEMGVLSYITGYLADRTFRQTGYPALIVNGIGMDRWNRLYHLDAFPQVLEMRTVIRKSELLRGLVPYTVSMTGKSYTRVEDFSYLNLVTVFGRLAAFAVTAYYIILLLRVFFRLNDTLRRRQTQFSERRTALFLLAQFMCLYIVTHALVHVISNLTFLFFTGVPMPFISKGLSNLAVVMVCSVVILFCLNWEENHANKRKKPARSAR